MQVLKTGHSQRKHKNEKRKTNVIETRMLETTDEQMDEQKEDIQRKRMHVKGTITRFDFDTKGKGNYYSKNKRK